MNVKSPLVKLITTLFLFILYSGNLFCQSGSFQKVIGGHGDETFPRVYATYENTFLILNRTSSSSLGDLDIMLTKVDSAGNILWTKNFGNSHRNLSKTLYKYDNGYMLLGWNDDEYKIDDWLLIKLDSLCNVLSFKNYGTDFIDEEIHNFTPVDENNAVILSTVREYSTNIRASVIDKEMNLVKTNTFINDGYDQWIRETIFSNGNVIGCGTHGNKPLLISVNSQGNLNYLFYIDIPGTGQLWKTISLNDNTLISVGYSNLASTENSEILVIKHKPDGEIIWIKTYGGIGLDKAFDTKLKNDKTILISGETTSFGSGKDLFLLNIDSNGNFINGYTYGGSENEDYGFIDIASDGSTILVGETESFNSTSKDILIIKTDTDGSNCCSSKMDNLSINTLSVHSIQVSTQTISDYVTQSDHPFQTKTWTPGSKLVCSEPLEIIGPESVCINSKDIKYHTTPQNPFGFYSWALPPGAEIANNQHDTVIWINFDDTPGYLYLNAKYCENKVFDSIYVSLNGLLPNLGNDTSICSGNKVKLSPGSGYTTYLWQTGSTEPFLIADHEGWYWVEVSDSSNCSGRDSIYLSVINTPTIDLGPDTIFLNADNYTLDAGPGFNNYIWNDNSTSQTLLVSEEGLYWVRGFFGGCTDTDSVWLFRPECNVLISNILTPNDDGINDNIFAINPPQVSNFEFSVYDLHGLLLFKTDDIYFKWDGKINGYRQPNSIYLYTMKYDCSDSSETKNQSGKIIIMR